MTGFFDSRRQMGVLAAATMGSVLSTTATVHSVFGPFPVPLSEDFGWSRASISAVMAIIAISCAIAYPLVGRYSDKHGSRRMILFGNVALGLSIAALALTSGSLAQFYLTFLAIGVFGVSAMYSSARSMALRLTGSFSFSGSGTRSSILTTISGDVPQLTCGRNVFASISTTWSNAAPGSVWNVRQ